MLIRKKSVLERILAIKWEPDDSRVNSHIALLREYLRRAALWAKALDCTDESGGIFSMEHGFFDFAVGSFPRGKWQQYDEKMAAEWANPQIEALLSESAIAVNPSLVVRDHAHSQGDRGHNH